MKCLCVVALVTVLGCGDTETDRGSGGASSSSAPGSTGVGGAAATGGSGGGSGGGGGARAPGLITCGDTTCDARSQDCCVSGAWEEICGSKGSCMFGALSCSSAASCAMGQVCCASTDMAGTPTAVCATAPCPAYQLCSSTSECVSGGPCSGSIYPGSPAVCDKCAGVSCNAGDECCPSSGACCPTGSGSCCT